MSWREPKTNWVSSDYISDSDYNRINDNLFFLQRLCQELYTISIVTLSGEKTVSDVPYEDMLNAIEEVLTRVNTASYHFAIGSQATFSANNPYWDYNELNRIESATLKLYLTLNSEKGLYRHIPFTLGGAKTFQVPRITYRPFNLVMAWRLGNSKTFVVPRGYMS